MFSPSFTHRTAATLLLLLGCLAGAGCSLGQRDGWKFADWDVRRSIGWKKDKPDPEVPARMVTTWTDSVLHTVGQESKRGFGGRLIFFSGESEDPVRVDGQLVVYAFDETDRPTHETHPTRKYVFPAEQFVKHESDTQLGASYSVWLPWDAVGGKQKKVSLIARFEPQGGAIVMGEQTRHLLPGVTLEGQPETQFADTHVEQSTQEVELAGFNRENPPPASTASAVDARAVETRVKMSTATIPLPQRLGTRMQEPPTNTRVAATNAARAPRAQAPSQPLVPAPTPSAGFAPATPPAPSTPAAPPAPARGEYLRTLEGSPFGR